MIWLKYTYILHNMYILYMNIQLAISHIILIYIKMKIAFDDNGTVSKLVWLCIK